MSVLRMRRQPLSGSCLARPAQSSALFRHMTIWSSVLLAAAALCVLTHKAHANDVKVDAGGDAIDLHSGGGMPDTNPRVKSILAAHPNDFVTICVAGCDGGKSKIVQILPRPVTGRTAELVPSSAKDTYGPPKPGKSSHRGSVANEGSDVICVAGCMEKPGQILERIKDLPPLKAPAKSASAGKSKDSSAKP
jgi:hypothetical protein